MSDSSLLSALGSRVRELRDARGWSRRELCAESGVSERFLAEIEAGRGNPSVMSLDGIARALGTSSAALLTAKPAVIALLGLRGAGKSTVGRALARKTKMPFVELDERIERAAGLSLREVFEIHGESHYRRVEREALGAFLATTKRAVLATGGGLVTDRETFEQLRQGSVVFWLRARPEVHWARVVAQGDRRPMANDPTAMERLRELLRERGPLYERAHHVIDVSDSNVADVVREIEKRV